MRGYIAEDSCDSASHVLNVTDSSDIVVLNDVLKNASRLEGSVCIRLSRGCFNLSPDEPTYLSTGLVSHALNLAFDDVIIQGAGQEYTSIECVEEAGLGFSGSRISISGLMIFNCGGLQDSTSLNSSNATVSFRSGLHFHAVHSLSVKNVSVYCSPGVGMTLYNVDEDVIIEDCSFWYNRVPRKEIDEFPGGGGLYIEFSYCAPGVVDPQCHQPYNYNSFSRYNINNCTFAENNATTLTTINNTFHTPRSIYHQAFARGGGLSIFFKGNATGNSFFISDCTFSNNVALWGGGFFAEFQDNVTSNRVVMSHSTLSGNKCKKIPGFENSGTAGGGMRLGFIATGYDDVSNNSLEFSYLYVNTSEAMIGGGTAFYSSREVNRTSPTNRIVFNNCFWFNNTGLIGAAVNIHAWLPSTEGILPTVVFNSAFFLRNNATYSETQNYKGTAAVYVDSIPVQFNGIVSFLSNTGGGLAAIVTGIDVREFASVSFINNTAIRGGGVQLLGYAYLRMWPNSTMHFVDNKASMYGGAIYSQYVGNSVAVYYVNCFIRPDDYYLESDKWSFNFTFERNCARMRGNDIYATTLVPCLWPYVVTGTTYNSNSVRELFRGFTYIAGDCATCSTSIATGEANFETDSNRTHTFYSGESVHVPIKTKDELNHPMEAVLLSSIPESNGDTVTWLTYADGTIVLKKDEVFASSKNISTTVSFQNVGERIFEVDITFTMVRCPDGKIYHNITKECECGDVPLEDGDISPYKGLIACGDQRLLVDPAYWVGHTPGDVFAIGECPLGFCNENKATDALRIPVSDGQIESDTCVEGRTGVLCGKCTDGHAPQVGSMTNLHCVFCPFEDTPRGHMEGAILYITFEAFPLIVFFSYLFLFSLNITHGPLHSFVFFSQVVPTLLQFNLDLEVLHWPPVGFFYSMWQMNILSIIKRYICFFPGASGLQVVALEGIKPVVALGFMALTIFCIRQTECCCGPCRRLWGKIRRLVRKVRRKIVADNDKPLINGFVAVTIVCFAKVIAVSMNLLAMQDVYTTLNNQPGSYYVSKVEGGTKYLEMPHLAYMVGATVAILLALGLPLLLFYFALMTLLVSKQHKLRKCFVGEKILKVFLDDFYKGFKLHLTFFAPLYLLYRVLFWTIFAFCFGRYSRSALLQVLLTLILGIHCLVQPFQKALHNRIETFNLLNLTLINSLALFRVFWLQTTQSSITRILLVVDIIRVGLAMLPAVLLLGYILLKMGKACWAKIRRQNDNQTLDEDEYFFGVREEMDTDQD